MIITLRPSRGLIASALIAACVACGSPGDAEPGVQGGPSEAQWFSDVTEISGIDFRHESGATGGLYLPEIMGGGVALFDADGDGDLDVYLVNQNRLLPDGGRSDEEANRLYLRQPDGRYADGTVPAGLGDGGFGMGVAVGDIDNDGDVDLYVTNYGPDRLYRNRGDGTYEEISASAGIDVDGWSTSATFLDYDRDGYLDLYVAAYVVWDPAKRCSTASGRRSYCGPQAFPGGRDVLFHNNGDGTFADLSAAAGIRGVAAAGLGVVSDDFDGDGWPDIYVANDGDANLLWTNQRDGTFADDAVVMGAAYNNQGQPEAGMGVVAADLDNDGYPDLFMTHLTRETNTLYRNLGDGRGFVDRTELSGLGLNSWELTGFGTAAFDVELDGDLDLFVGNGRVKLEDGERLADPAAPWDALAQPNLFYLNDGQGRFRGIEKEVTSLCATAEVTRGVAAGDVDGDGDLDLLLGNIHGPPRLFRNDAPRSGSWLTVRARDPRLDRDAIGARVTVRGPGGLQVRSITRGQSYLSSSPPVAHFGFPSGEVPERIEVRWPDGLVELFPGSPLSRERVLVRGEGRPRP